MEECHALFDKYITNVETVSRVNEVTYNPDKILKGPLFESFCLQKKTPLARTALNSL